MKHLFTNDTDTYIAERSEDVPDLYEAHNGETYPEDELFAWTRVDDTRKISVGFEGWQDAWDALEEAKNSGANLHDACVIRRTRADEWMADDASGDGRVVVEATAAWWALGESGFLCSTEW